MAENYASLTVSSSCANSGSTTTYTDGTTTTGDYYTWIQPWTDDVYYDIPPPLVRREQVIPNVVQIIKESEVTKVADLRTLFRVYVVNPKKNGKILVNGEAVIAVNENQAMLKAGVAQVAAKENVDIEDLDVYVEEVGTFIRPRKKAEKVRIVKADEED